MFNTIYLARLRLRYHNYIRRVRRFKDLSNEYAKGPYRLLQAIVDYEIPFDMLDRSTLEQYSKKLSEMYICLIEQYRRDFVIYYKENQAGYRDGLHLYVWE